jgi:hypothetical protein
MIVAEALGSDPQQRRRDMRAVPQLCGFVHDHYLPSTSAGPILYCRSRPRSSV